MTLDRAALAEAANNAVCVYGRMLAGFKPIFSRHACLLVVRLKVFIVIIGRRLSPRLCTRFRRHFLGQDRGSRACIWRIKCRESHIYLGRFADERDAALDYDAAAKIAFGEYAKLNFHPAASESIILSERALTRIERAKQ